MLAYKEMRSALHQQIRTVKAACEGCVTDE
jgi:hypothetical protein